MAELSRYIHVSDMAAATDVLILSVSTRIEGCHYFSTHKVRGMCESRGDSSGVCIYDNRLISTSKIYKQSQTETVRCLAEDVRLGFCSTRIQNSTM